MSEQQQTDPAGEQQNESPNAEAAKWRTKLRETETERDGLRERVASFQKSEVERHAAEHIVKPDALWSAGVKVEDLLGEDGSVDPAKVRTAALDAADRLGLEKPRAGVASREGGNQRPGGSTSFEDAFKINNR